MNDNWQFSSLTPTSKTNWRQTHWTNIDDRWAEISQSHSQGYLVYLPQLQIILLCNQITQWNWKSEEKKHSKASAVRKLIFSSRRGVLAKLYWWNWRLYFASDTFKVLCFSFIFLLNIYRGFIFASHKLKNQQVSAWIILCDSFFPYIWHNGQLYIQNSSAIVSFNNPLHLLSFHS